MGRNCLDFLQISKNEKNIDYLTGLINRRGFYEMWRQIPMDMSVHCIYMDVDNFKLVNDIYGHAKGDELLVYVSQIIRNTFPGQLVVRMGGDEFVVVCDGTIEEDILKRQLQDLQRLIKDEFDESLSAVLSFSMGATIRQPVSKGISVILDQCDRTMYYVKKSGKNNYVSYEEIEDSLIEQKAMKDRALTALSQNEIVMLLQPIIYMQNSDVYAAQVVMQWDFPGMGILPEKKFLPVFEQYGVIAQLDEMVIDQVCKWKNQWKDTVFEHIKLCIRISGLYMMETNSICHLKNCLEMYQIPAQELILCIEENTFLGRNEKLWYAIERLAEIGFDIAIQNFGSASSFQVLQHISAKMLKLDPTLLPLSTNTEQKEVKILRNVISIGRDLQFLILAQGVENSSQAVMLTNYGAQLGVGDFYGVAQSAEEFYQNYRERYFFAGNSQPTVYHFKGNLADEDGKYEGSYQGEGLTYTTGVMESQPAIHLPGGKVRENLISLPKSVMYSDSYTICLWVNTEEAQYWTSIFYMTYMDGFMSLVPSDARGSCIFRLKDEREPNEWFDLFSRGAVPGEWAYICVSYDVITGVAKLYFNGILRQSRDQAPNLKVIDKIYVGGDDYQESYRGKLAGLEIYHCVLSAEEIEKKYKECQSNDI